jgi:hypothetical protein
MSMLYSVITIEIDINNDELLKAIWEHAYAYEGNNKGWEARQENTYY